MKICGFFPANKSLDGNIAAMLPFGKDQMATL